MQDVEIIGMIKSYIKKTLVGMGALKGSPCEVQDIVNEDGSHTVTMQWQDSEGQTYTRDFTIKDGKDGTNGTNGTNGVDGVSPSIVVKTSTDATYILTITTATDSFDTPNLKGGGSGGASNLVDLSDVDFTDLADEQIIYYNATDEKFENVDAGAVSETVYSAIASLLS